MRSSKCEAPMRGNTVNSVELWTPGLGADNPRASPGTLAAGRGCPSSAVETVPKCQGPHRRQKPTLEVTDSIPLPGSFWGREEGQKLTLDKRLLGSGTVYRGKGEIVVALEKWHTLKL